MTPSAAVWSRLMYSVRSTLSRQSTPELFQNQGSLLCLASLKGNASSHTYSVSCFRSASVIAGVVAKNNVLLAIWVPASLIVYWLPAANAVLLSVPAASVAGMITKPRLVLCDKYPLMASGSFPTFTCPTVTLPVQICVAPPG